MNTDKFVTNRGNKRQNWKFRSNVAGRIAGPIDLRISKTKTSVVKVTRNRGDVALPPAPVVDVGLINEHQPHRDGYNPNSSQQFAGVAATPRDPEGDRSSAQKNAPEQSASPLSQGERMEVRGLRHHVSTKINKPSPAPLP